MIGNNSFAVEIKNDEEIILSEVCDRNITNIELIYAFCYGAACFSERGRLEIKATCVMGYFTDGPNINTCILSLLSTVTLYLRRKYVKLGAPREFSRSKK